MLERLDKTSAKKVFAIMCDSFPTKELRTQEGQEQLWDNPYYHVYAVRDEEQEIAAFLAVWELEKLTFIEHFAVTPALRGGGMGGKMLQELLGVCPKPVILEVELPKTEIARRRIGFYERNGFVLNEFVYRQPPLQEEVPPLSLYLMSYPDALDEQSFAWVRGELYTKVYADVLQGASFV